jgi:hypothetical protein
MLVCFPAPTPKDGTRQGTVLVSAEGVEGRGGKLRRQVSWRTGCHACCRHMPRRL